MKQFCTRLLLAALPCFAPAVSAHPGHAEHATSLPVGWHAAYHGTEWTLVTTPAAGIGMLVAGLLLVAAGLVCHHALGSRAWRLVRDTGIVLGGSGLWLLLG